MIQPTGTMWNVYPFKDGYEVTKDIPFATCATLMQTDEGLDYILIGHEMPYFGREMEWLLLNQNQI